MSINEAYRNERMALGELGTVEHYFVVVGVKDEEGKLHYFLDDGTLESRFDEGSVWSNKIGEWKTPKDGSQLATDDAELWHELDARIHNDGGGKPEV
jgi:hypothetical protein